MKPDIEYHGDRGFAQFAKFTDGYQNEICIKESSSAEGDFLWIFIEGEAHLRETPRPFVGLPLGLAKASVATHINREQAVTIRDAINTWLEYIECEHDWIDMSIGADGKPNSVIKNGYFCPHCRRIATYPEGHNAS